MAKRVRELKNGNGTVPNLEEVTFSSKVTVPMLPFPVGLWEEINIRAFQEYPDPVPPKKTIKTVDGTEEVDDLENPEYKAEVQRIGNRRGALLTEAILDMCPQLELGDREEAIIRRLEKYSPPFPDDPFDRKVEYMTRYVLRTKSDFELLTIAAITPILIDDPEVAERIAYFQSQVQGAADSFLNAPGPDAGKRVEVPQKGT